MHKQADKELDPLMDSVRPKRDWLTAFEGFCYGVVFTILLFLFAGSFG